MSKINGEMVVLLDNITFDSKKELLEILRAFREETLKFDSERRAIIKQLIGVGIQQIYRTSERELLNYKRYQIEKTRR